MAEIYTQKIGIETDWNGDSSTNYLPVSGEKVQEFIKDELKSKIGAFYKPSGGNYIYGFASQENSQTAYFTVFGRQGNVRVVFGQRIELDTRITESNVKIASLYFRTYFNVSVSVLIGIIDYVFNHFFNT